MSLVVKNSIRIEKISYVLYSINLDVFSIAIEFLTTNDLDSGVDFWVREKSR